MSEVVSAKEVEYLKSQRLARIGITPERKTRSGLD